MTKFLTCLIISLSIFGCLTNEDSVIESSNPFDENYDLMSLEETEQFISENSHLPLIPAASEIDVTVRHCGFSATRS